MALSIPPSESLNVTDRGSWASTNSYQLPPFVQASDSQLNPTIDIGCNLKYCSWQGNIMGLAILGMDMNSGVSISPYGCTFGHGVSDNGV